MEDKRIYQKKGQERMNREKLNEQLFDVFLAEALWQIEEEELQKSETFFEEHKMEDYVPSKRFARRIKRAYQVYAIKRYLSSRTIRRASSILLMVGMISGSLIFLAEANGFSLYETIFMNIENKGQHPSFNLFFKLVTLFDISVDQFFYTEGQRGENSCRKNIDVLLSLMNEKELVVMEATAEGLKKARETEVQEVWLFCVSSMYWWKQSKHGLLY